MCAYVCYISFLMSEKSVSIDTTLLAINEFITSTAEFLNSFATTYPSFFELYSV